MVSMMKAKLRLALAVLFITVAGLIGVSRSVTAQTLTPVSPTPNTACEAQDTTDTAKDANAPSNPEEPSGAEDLQCGDQNAPDDGDHATGMPDSGTDSHHSRQNGPQV